MIRVAWNKLHASEKREKQKSHLQLTIIAGEKKEEEEEKGNSTATLLYSQSQALYVVQSV